MENSMDKKDIKEFERTVLQDFITEFEKSHFRTISDTGAHYQTMFLWGMVRSRAGLPRLEITDLPAFCYDCKAYHVRPHSRKPSTEEAWIVERFRRAGIWD